MSFERSPAAAAISSLVSSTNDPLETVRRFYEQGVTDEFMEPISVLTPAGSHEGRVEDGDALIFFNFRADRMRQIVTSFKDAGFNGFTRAVTPRAAIITQRRSAKMPS